MTIHSIKWRLQLWHGTLLALLVTGLMAGFYHFEQRTQLEAVDAELREALAVILPRWAPPRSGIRPNPGPPGPDRLRPSVAEDPRFNPPPIIDEFPPPSDAEVDPIRNGRIYFIAWNRVGTRLAATTNAPPDLQRPDQIPRYPGNGPTTRGTDRELIQRLPNGRCLLLGTSLAPVQQHLRQLAVALTLIGVGIIVVGFAVGWWLASRSLRPIADISQAAQEIAGGDLSRRIDATETESELGHLIAVLNSSFERLETAFAQQQQFTSDAAHELRTPVSVILAQVQSTLARDRSTEEYRQTLEACQRSAQRMKQLIESLLQLARFDAGQEPLERVRFPLDTKVRECLELVQPLADDRAVRISSTLVPAECVGDPERLSQVIINLLMNAVTYNVPGGEVQVSNTVANGHLILTVRDTGPGISPEDAPHVFKRFYRADKSRSANTARSGLGLAISKSIVIAHGGTLDFTSTPGMGTTFTLRLPQQ